MALNDITLLQFLTPQSYHACVSLSLSSLLVFLLTMLQLLPNEEGVYEIRWHVRNQYGVKAKQPIIIEGINTNTSEDEDDGDN